MHIPSSKIVTLALAPALVAAAVACSSGNNNKNNTTSTTNNAANSAATRAAVATAALTPAAPRAATAAPSVAASSTVRTATPAATTRPATAAATTRPATAAAGAASISASPAAGGAVTDQALQTQLMAALLKASDLPQGFTAQGAPTSDVTLPGQTADTSITYTKIGQGASGLDIQALVVGLGGFKDSNSAGTQFAGVKDQIANASGADFSLTSVPNAPKIGDESQAFTVSGSSQGFTLNGYAIVWHRGKVDAFLVLVGVTQIDQAQVTQLAQKQDANLSAAGL